MRLPDEKYGYVLSSPVEKVGGAKQTVNRMLNGEWSKGPPGAAWRKTATVIKRGILVFRLNEDGVRELATAPRDDGDYWSLVRFELAPPFREVFPIDHKPAVLPAQYDGGRRRSGSTESCRPASNLPRGVRLALQDFGWKPHPPREWFL